MFCLYPLDQCGVRWSIVIGTGGHPGKRAAVTVIPVSLCIFIVGVVVIGGGASLHKNMVW